MVKFQMGQNLSARSACDHTCVFTGVVLKRTEKTVTIKTDMGGIRRCKIYDDYDEEWIYPFGSYSMAPIFRAGVAQ